LLALASEGLARVTRRPPLVARGELQFLLWNAVPDSTKAQQELGWRPTPFEVGVQQTLQELGLMNR
jgi:nucleoside-diphosphate-sugar epimerase